jgi:hypothetical protein
MHWVDPDYLPETKGTFERFLVNPRGEADGMILTDGTEVHFPPHLSPQMQAAIRPGETFKVSVRGVRPRNSELIAAVAIDLPDGTRVLDQGPDEVGHDGPAKGRGGHGKHDPTCKQSPMQASGIVRCVLHGPKGEARGVLLEDGKLIRFPHHAAPRFAKLLAPGKNVAARGEGLTSTLATVIDAKEFGASLQDLHRIENKGPKHARHAKRSKHPKHTGD